MKKKTEKKKLVLAKETVRTLGEMEMMKEVVGGMTQMSCQWRCFATEENTNSVCIC